MTDPQTAAQLKGLRDFFTARNASELSAAYTYLADWTHAPTPTVTDWQAIEFAFNRLFVGPKAPIAPPFASVYLEPEPQLMGQSTMKVRQVYNLAGLQSPLKNIIPEDHISFELDAYHQFSTALRAIVSSELIALQYYLLRHLGLWLPEFISRVRSTEAVPPAIHFVVDSLEVWLTQELAVDRHTSSEMPSLVQGAVT